MSLSTIQIALAAESTVNILSVFGIYRNPSFLLNLLLPATTLHTAALKSFTEWIAALTLGVTIPMLLCIPDGPDARPARHMLYLASGAIEGTIAGTALAQYIRGGSGFTDNALLGTMATFGLLTAFRAYFCYVQPSLLESKSNTKTKTR